ncbi:hypothetical protein [Pseudomonas sp. PDM31]|uniref:hypothetical protein n=1 Tax=Pseudomonas sp. PDM31 TaxID=2854778 RepID=UPI001C445A8A|nr:hypothetical protein [Pseudomonas sp. PDM31]MBV7477188.1 hypothetical protein [Pseudomonas sp. PDM31]
MSDNKSQFDTDPDEAVAQLTAEQTIAAAGDALKEGSEQFKAFAQQRAAGEDIVIRAGVEIDLGDERLQLDARRVCAEFNFNVNKALIAPDRGLPTDQLDTRFFPVEPFLPLVARTIIVAQNNKLSVLEVDGTLNRGLSAKGYAVWRDRCFALAIPPALKAALSGENIEQRIGNAMKMAKDAIPASLETLRQVDVIAYEVDVFATHASMKLADRIAHVTVPFKPFVAKGKRNPELVQTFITEHFVEFDDLLRFVAASRFMPTRRACSVWLHAVSDFGKGLVAAAMAKLGATVEVGLNELVLAMDGKPSGLMPGPFLHAWIVFVDEFKAAIAELKRMNDVITFASKGQPRTTVPIYTKLFASAEEVQSLTGNGIEKQFDARFCVLRPKHSETPILGYEWYKAAGDDAMRQALEHHIAEVFNAEVERYRAMGKDAAPVAAKKVVAEFRKGRLLSDHYESLSAVVDDVAEGLRDLLRDYCTKHGNEAWRRSVGPGVLRILETHVSVVTSGYDAERGQPAVFISQRGRTKLIKDYLNETSEKSAAGKISYKVGDILDRLKHPRTDEQGRVRFVAPDARGYKRTRGLLVVFGKPMAVGKDVGPIPELAEDDPPMGLF